MTETDNVKTSQKSPGGKGPAVPLRGRARRPARPGDHCGLGLPPNPSRLWRLLWRDGLLRAHGYLTALYRARDRRRTPRPSLCASVTGAPALHTCRRGPTPRCCACSWLPCFPGEEIRRRSALLFVCGQSSTYRNVSLLANADSSPLTHFWYLPASSCSLCNQPARPAGDAKVVRSRRMACSAVGILAVVPRSSRPFSTTRRDTARVYYGPDTRAAELLLGALAALWTVGAGSSRALPRGGAAPLDAPAGPAMPWRAFAWRALASCASRSGTEVAYPRRHASGCGLTAVWPLASAVRERRPTCWGAARGRGRQARVCRLPLALPCWWSSTRRRGPPSFPSGGGRLSSFSSLPAPKPPPALRGARVLGSSPGVPCPGPCRATGGVCPGRPLRMRFSLCPSPQSRQASPPRCSR